MLGHSVARCQSSTSAGRARADRARRRAWEAYRGRDPAVVLERAANGGWPATLPVSRMRSASKPAGTVTRVALGSLSTGSRVRYCVEHLAAAGVDDAGGGADLGVGERGDVLLEEIDEPALALEHRRARRARRRGFFPAAGSAGFSIAAGVSRATTFCGERQHCRARETRGRGGRRKKVRKSAWTWEWRSEQRCAGDSTRQAGASKHERYPRERGDVASVPGGSRLRCALDEIGRTRERREVPSKPIPGSTGEVLTTLPSPYRRMRPRVCSICRASSRSAGT